MLPSSRESSIKTIIDVADVPLEGPIYDGLHAHLHLEVRDFGTPERTLVLRSFIEGEVVTTMVSLAKFEDAFDGMRARMMAPDWDTAMIQLQERSTDL